MPKIRFLDGPIRLPKYVPVRKNAESNVPKLRGFLSGLTDSVAWWKKRW